MNVAGTTLAKYRRSLIEKRYTGMVLDHMPQSKFWFVLSGTRGDKVLYEHVAFSCDGKSIHGWQMLYPLSERTFYDLVADEIHRNTRTSQARCALRRGLSEIMRRKTLAIAQASCTACPPPGRHISLASVADTVPSSNDTDHGYA